LNGDEFPDLILSRNPQILLGVGDGTFLPGSNFEERIALTAVESADFDRDGKIDIVYKAYGTSGVRIQFGSGNGTFETRTDLLEPGSAHNYSHIAVSDLNKDGYQDIALLHSEAPSGNRDTIEVWINEG